MYSTHPSVFVLYGWGRVVLLLSRRNLVKYCELASFSLDQQRVQQTWGHRAAHPARRWLPGQQVPPSDNGTCNHTRLTSDLINTSQGKLHLLNKVPEMMSSHGNETRHGSRLMSRQSVTDGRTEPLSSSWEVPVNFETSLMSRQHPPKH